MVAMRMVLAKHLTDDAGGFAIGAVHADAHIVHGVQDAALDRLEAIACIRQGACHDHAHGVIEVGLLHFLVNIYFAYQAEFHGILPPSPFPSPSLMVRGQGVEVEMNYVSAVICWTNDCLW